MPPLYKQHSGLILLAVTALFIMGAAACVDVAWTEALDEIQWPSIENLMGRSIFEGEGLGANDLVIFLLMAVIVVYYLACRKPGQKKWAAWRPDAGFALAAALVTGVYLVHSLKWVMGRARPDLVIKKGMAFSHWFAFGPHFITDGIYYGSFPSGHTSQMFILMTLAFTLAGNPLLPRMGRMAGWCWGGMAFAVSLLMGLTRCMTLSHWLTDILGSIMFGWVIMHLLYYYILKVPDQHRFMARNHRLPEWPEAWEIKLCLYGLIGVAGGMTMMIGLRALLMHKGWGWLTLIPVGAAAMRFCWKRGGDLLYRIWHDLGSNTEKMDRPVDDTTAISK